LRAGVDPGHLEPPVVGRFEGNIGYFECDDTFEGRAIRVQYQWTRKGANHARWQQAFSPDGGKTWEVNWAAEFHARRADLKQLRSYRMTRCVSQNFLPSFNQRELLLAQVAPMQILRDTVA